MHERFTSMRPPVAAAVPQSAAGCQRINAVRSDLGHLEGDVAAVAHDLRADLDELPPSGSSSTNL
jgi:hypothetical protein